MIAAHHQPRVSRRRFVQGAGVAGLGLLAGCGGWPGQGQPAAVGSHRPRLVGVLAPDNPSDPATWDRVEPFRQGLTELGYSEGRNLTIEYRFAANDATRLSALADELVSLGVETILALGPLAAPAARDATRTIPVVFAYVGDPVGTGLVASLAKPGGNVTGLSNLSEGLSAKRLQLLVEALPGTARVAVVFNPAVPSNAADVAETWSAAKALDIQLISLAIRASADYDDALQVATREQAEAVIWLGDTVTGPRIAEFLQASRLPAMFRLLAPQFQQTGLLLYAPNPVAMLRRAAAYIDRILTDLSPVS